MSYSLSDLFDLPDMEPDYFWKKDKIPNIDEVIPCEESMTICIALMAEATTPSPKIVFTADRQITTKSIKFSNSMSKYNGLTDYAGIMISSNNLLISVDIVSKVMEEVKKYLLSGKKLEIREIVEIVKRICIERFQNEQNNGFLGQFLVLGIDQTPRPFTPHIYTVNEKGQDTPHDIHGWAVIGSGSNQALRELTRCKCTSDTPQCRCGYNPNMELSEVIIRAYNAKKVAAEQTFCGVGESIDLAVLRCEENIIGVQPMPQKIFDILDWGRDEIKKYEWVVNEVTMHYLEDLPRTIPTIYHPKQWETNKKEDTI